MKRINRRLLAVVASSALALPMAAQVQADEMEVKPHSHPAMYEHGGHEMDDGSMTPMHAHEYDSHPHADLHSHSLTLYASVRSGIYMNKPEGGDTTWDIGSADAGSEAGKDGANADKLWSRIGVRGSTELDGGVTAGLEIERRLDNFRSRTQFVYLQGDLGRVTLGQQGSSFDAATGWDNMYFLGGNNRVGGPGRKQGVKFSSSLGGPFDFEVMVTDDNSQDTVQQGQGNGVDEYQVAGSLSLGIVNVNAVYKNVKDTAEYWGGTVGGSFQGLGWELGFVTEDPETGSGADGFGGAVSYGMGDGAAYLYYDDVDSDAGDKKSWGVGYAHELGPGVRVIAEYADNDGVWERSVVGVRVDF